MSIINHKTHLIGGAGAGVIVYPLIHYSLRLPPQNLLSITGVACVFAGVVGSLLPDIDHHNSKIGKTFKITSFITRKLFGHRWITHGPLVVTVFLSLVLFVLTIHKDSFQYPNLVYAFVYGSFGGIYSHILLDALTPRGIPFLCPFSRKKTALASIRTGGKGEALFGVFLGMIVFLIAAKQI